MAKAIELAPPSEKLYFVKRRGMKYEPEREAELRKVRKVEKKVKLPKTVKKRLERTAYKQRGLTKVGEERKAIAQARGDIFPAIESMEQLRERALVPQEKERLKAEREAAAVKKAQLEEAQMSIPKLIEGLPAAIQRALVASLPEAAPAGEVFDTPEVAKAISTMEASVVSPTPAQARAVRAATENENVLREIGSELVDLGKPINAKTVRAMWLEKGRSGNLPRGAVKIAQNWERPPSAYSEVTPTASSSEEEAPSLFERAKGGVSNIFSGLASAFQPAPEGLRMDVPTAEDYAAAQAAASPTPERFQSPEPEVQNLMEVAQQELPVQEVGMAGMQKRLEMEQASKQASKIAQSMRTKQLEEMSPVSQQAIEESRRAIAKRSRNLPALEMPAAAAMEEEPMAAAAAPPSTPLRYDEKLEAAANKRSAVKKLLDKPTGDRTKTETYKKLLDEMSPQELDSAFDKHMSTMNDSERNTIIEFIREKKKAEAAKGNITGKGLKFNRARIAAAVNAVPDAKGVKHYGKKKWALIKKTFNKPSKGGVLTGAGFFSNIFNKAKEAVMSDPVGAIKKAFEVGKKGVEVGKKLKGVDIKNNPMGALSVLSGLGGALPVKHRKRFHDNVKAEFDRIHGAGFFDKLKEGLGIFTSGIAAPFRLAAKINPVFGFGVDKAADAVGVPQISETLGAGLTGGSFMGDITEHLLGKAQAGLKNVVGAFTHDITTNPEGVLGLGSAIYKTLMGGGNLKVAKKFHTHLKKEFDRIHGAGFFSNLVKKAASAVINKVKDDPIGALKQGIELGKKGVEYGKQGIDIGKQLLGKGLKTKKPRKRVGGLSSTIRMA